MPKTVLLGVLMLLASCAVAQSEDDSQELATAQAVLAEQSVVPPPEYLSFIWPKPGEAILMHDYDTAQLYDFEDQGICVEFEVYYMLEAGDFLTQEELAPRFSLRIDDYLINDPSYIMLRDTGGDDGPPNPETGEPLFQVPPGSPYFICFARELRPGLHTATFSAQKTSGVMLSYTWPFFLIDIAPTPTPSPMPFEPLPRFIETTYPSPGAVVNLDEYTEDGLGYYFGLSAPGICVSFLPYPFILEPGDVLTSEDVIERLSLEVDGSTYGTVDSYQVELVMFEGVPRVPIDPETGEPEASVPEGRYIVCFENDLEPGMHSATFSAQKTSGEKIEYTWPFFIITE
ncbi:MAG: hypothetical protein IT327_20805 [Anaerolineae bacterium]|nr:hypothetical protein [Anaerolineae bacterium]